MRVPCFKVNGCFDVFGENIGMGALSFSPMSEFSATTHADIDLATLGLEAQTLFDASMSDYMD